MNKKILLIVLALALVLFSCSLIGTVMAGNETNKVTFEFTFADQVYFALEPTKVSGQTRHAFLGFNLGVNGVVHLVIDGEDYYSYGTGYSEVSDFTYYSEMEIETHKPSDTEKDFATMHWWYTLDFGEGNVITVMANGINYRTTPATSWANIVGFGTGIFENLILKGTAGNDETGLIVHKGTIMGW